MERRAIVSAAGQFQPSLLSKLLIAVAAIHTFLWGLVVLTSVERYFGFSGLDARLIVMPDTTWGVMGMLGGMIYLTAVILPRRMGPISVFFFLFNLAGLGLVSYWTAVGTMQTGAGIAHIVGNLAGAVGFGLSTWEYYRWKTDLLMNERYFEGGEIGHVLQVFMDQNGRTLDELNREKPVLLVFLRHFGCTFCRESLADLSRYKEEIEGGGVRIALVHMVDEITAAHHIANYRGLQDVSRVSDPDKRLYRAFGLQRGSMQQLFGVKEWVEGFRAGILNGHLVGRQIGDGFQMPGVFLIQNGNIRRGFRHKNAADRPDYQYTADFDEPDAPLSASPSTAIS